MLNDWTKREIYILEKYYVADPNKTEEENARRLRGYLQAKSVNKIIHQARLCGVSHPLSKSKPWKKRELEYIRTYYGTRSEPKLLYFINRTEKAIKAKAVGMGFKPYKSNLYKANVEKINENIADIEFKSIRTLSETLDVPYGTVQNYIRKHRAKAIKNKWDEASDIDVKLSDLNNETYQILMGTILSHKIRMKPTEGDAIVTGFNGCTSVDRANYLLWVGKMIEGLLPIVDVRDHPVLRRLLVMPPSKLLESIGMDGILNGELPMDQIKKLDPLGMLIWYANRGGPRTMIRGDKTYPSPVIAVSNYNGESVEEAVGILNKKFNLSMILKDYGGSIKNINLLRRGRNFFFPQWEQLIRDMNIPMISDKVPKYSEAGTKKRPRWFSEKELEFIYKHRDMGIDFLQVAFQNRPRQTLITKLRELETNIPSDLVENRNLNVG